MQQTCHCLNDELKEIKEKLSNNLPDSFDFKLSMLKYNIAANDYKLSLNKLYIFTQDNNAII